MFVNPYDIIKRPGQWLKANFHTHAGTGENTCGAYAIDDVIKLYKEAGYDVLTISNHDFYSDVSEYQSKYDIVLLNGFEYSQDKHMLCIDVNDVIRDSHQNVLNEVNQQEGFTILCHPNWIEKEYWPWQQISKLSGYLGIEIFNSLIFRLSGSGLATDTWDYLLSQGKLVWGFADDDFHRWYDLSKAWNVIYSVSKEKKDIKDAIVNGSFYTSTGLILNSFSLEDGLITLSAGSKETYIKDNTYKFIGTSGEILDTQYGEYGQYQLNGNERYVRAQVISEHGAMLWTQPIYNADILRRP